MATIAHKLHGTALPGPGNATKLLPYSMPVLLLASLLVRRTRIDGLDRLTMAWTALVLVAVLLLPKLVAGSLTAWAVPGVFAVAAIAQRRPATMVTLALFFSAALGSFHAFWNFPSTKAISLCLAGLWVASLCGLLVRGSRRLRLSAALWLWTGYLLITALMVPLAPVSHVATVGFEYGPWFMLAVPLLATGGWDRETLDRISRGVLLVAVLAGGYALYRVFAGPARQELALLELTPYNFVGGKLKAAGSFSSPQDMGTWMASIVPFCFAQMLTRKDRWRLLAVVACALCAFATLKSDLRVGLIGIIAGLVLTVVLYEASGGFPGLRLRTTGFAAMLGVAVVVGALALAGNSATHSYTGLLHPTHDQSYVDRVAKWSQALDSLRTEPFGYGIGSGSLQSDSATGLFSATGDTSVDNGFLKVALEQGLVIMVLFAAALLLMLGAMIRAAIRCTDPLDARLAIGGSAVLLSYLVVMMAEDASYDPRALATWIPVGLGMAAVTAIRPAAAQPAASSSR